MGHCILCSSFAELHVDNKHFFQVKEDQFKQVVKENLVNEAPNVSSEATTELSEENIENESTTSEDSVDTNLPPLVIEEGTTDDFKAPPPKKPERKPEDTVENAGEKYCSQDSASSYDKSMFVPESLESSGFNPSTAIHKDSFTAKEVSFQATVDKPLNFQTTKVQNPSTGEVITMQEAVDPGLIDSKTGQLIDESTGRRYSVNAALEKGIMQDSVTTLPALHELGEQGLYDPDSGTVKDGSHSVPLLDGIEEDLVDKNTIRIRGPGCGDTITLKASAVETGRSVDSSTGKSGSLVESVKHGLIAVAVAPIAAPVLLKQKIEEYLDSRGKAEAITLGEALDQGIITRDNLCIRDPFTGREMDLNGAIESGIVDANTGECIDKRSEQSVSFQQAVESGLLTVVSQPEDISNGQGNREQDKVRKPELSFDQSVEHEDFLGDNEEKYEEELAQADKDSVILGMMDQRKLDNVEVKDLAPGATICAEEATQSSILDPENGNVVPNKSAQLSFKDAIDGDLIVTCSGEDKCRSEKDGKDVYDSIESMSLVDAITDGFYSPRENIVIEPKSGKTMTIFEALDCGLIVMDNTMVDDHSSSQELSLAKLLELGLVDLEKGTIRDSTGEDVKLEDAVKNGMLFDAEQLAVPLSMLKILNKDLYDPETGNFFDPVTNEAITMKEAIERNIFDISSVVFNDPGSGEVFSLVESIDDGLVDTKRGLVKDTTSKEKIPLTEALDRNILIPRPMSIATAIDIGLFNEATQKFLDPVCGLFFGLEEAIDEGLIDSGSSIFDPSSEQALHFAKATAIGVLDARNGNIVNVHTGETISLNESVELGKMAMQVKAASVTEVVRSDMYDLKTNKVTVPITRKEMDLEDATVAEIVDPKSCPKDPTTGTSVSAIQDSVLNMQTSEVKHSETGSADFLSSETLSTSLALEEAVEQKHTKAKDPATGQNMVDPAVGMVFNAKTDDVIKLSDNKPTMSLREALEKGFYNPGTNTVTDPITKAEIGLGSAIELDIIDPYSKIRDPHTGKIYHLRECIEHGVLDPNFATIMDTNTGQSMTLADAFEKSTECPQSVSLVKVTEGGVVDRTTGKFKDPVDCGIGLVDPFSNTYTDQATGKVSNLEDLVKDASKEETKTVPKKLSGVIEQFGSTPKDPDAASSLAWTDVAAGISFHQAIDSGSLDPKTGIMNYDGEEMSLEEAVNSKIISISDVFVSKQDGPKICLRDALDVGQLAIKEGMLVDPLSGKKFTVEEILENNLLVILNTPVPDDDRTSSRNQSEVHAISCGQFEKDADPGSSHQMTMCQAVDGSVVSVDFIQTEYLATDDLSSLKEITKAGINDSSNSNTSDSSPKDKNLNLEEAKCSGLDVVATDTTSVRLRDAVQQRFYESDTGLITTPSDGQQFTLKEAIDARILDPQRSAVRDYCTQEVVPTEAAAESGLINLETSTIQDPVSGKPISIEEAIVSDILTTLPENFVEDRSLLEGEPGEEQTSSMEKPCDDSQQSSDSGELINADSEEPVRPQSQGLAMCVDQGLIQDGKS